MKIMVCKVFKIYTFGYLFFISISQQKVMFTIKREHSYANFNVKMVYDKSHERHFVGI